MRNLEYRLDYEVSDIGQEKDPKLAEIEAKLGIYIELYGELILPYDDDKAVESTVLDKDELEQENYKAKLIQQLWGAVGVQVITIEEMLYFIEKRMTYTYFNSIFQGLSFFSRQSTNENLDLLLPRPRKAMTQAV